MRPIASLVTSTIVFTLSGIAFADPTPRDITYFETELAKIDIKPAPGRATATVRPPPWCGQIKPTGEWTLNGLRRTIESYDRAGVSALIKAAETTCEFPNVPAVNKAVAMIMQYWINETGLSEAAALTSFTLRMDVKKFSDDQKALCAALPPPDETGGAELVYMKVRRIVFNCDNASFPDELPYYLDLTEPDEIVRLAPIVRHTSYAFKGTVSDNELVNSIVDRRDYALLSDQKLAALLETAPYKGNSFARATAMEWMAHARIGIEAIEREIAKRDPDWKELLVDAPARGVAAWQKLADASGPALARSNEVEKLLFGPSRKASKGCVEKLRGDLEAVIKPLEHQSDGAFKQALSAHPIASLLFTRFAACALVDDQAAWGGLLSARAKELRLARGPRLAAYYAAFEAIGKITADRPKFPLTAQNLWLMKHNPLLDAAGAGKTDDRFISDGKGIVKTVKKAGDGVDVTFITEKHQEMEWDCVSTGRISYLQTDGHVVYEQKCKELGMKSYDDTQKPVHIAAVHAAGIAPGAAVVFKATTGDARLAIPLTVWKDKAKKSVAAYYGLSF